MMEIKTVGVVGAGTMGQGIAQLCARCGFEVLLFDISDNLITDGIEKVKSSLQVAVDKGKLSMDDSIQSLARISPVKRLSDLKADIIIEAVVENLEIKQGLFKELEAINPEMILTTNTSSIPVTRIASVLKRPERFAGLHFFNPAPVMKLVEVISGASTSLQTEDALKNFAKKLKKVAVVAEDSPGFIVNRVARHFYVESLRILEEGVADTSTIDKLMRSSGFRMGPFELMDLIGVDTNFAVTNSIFEAFHFEGKFRPSRIQQQKVDAGHHGRKTGKGFYDYN